MAIASLAYFKKRRRVPVVSVTRSAAELDTLCKQSGVDMVAFTDAVELNQAKLDIGERDFENVIGEADRFNKQRRGLRNVANRLLVLLLSDVKDTVVLKSSHSVADVASPKLVLYNFEGDVSLWRSVSDKFNSPPLSEAYMRQ